MAHVRGVTLGRVIPWRTLLAVHKSFFIVHAGTNRSGGEVAGC